MPAGDGAMRRVDSPACQHCGATLTAGIYVGVDDWTAFVCHDHEERLRESAPASCIVYAFPTAEEVEDENEDDDENDSDEDDEDAQTTTRRGTYDRHGYHTIEDGFEDGDHVELVYESPYSGTEVTVEGVASDVHASSFTLTLDDGREWGVFGESIRTTENSRRASGTTNAKNGRTVGSVRTFHVDAAEEDSEDSEDDDDDYDDDEDAPEVRTDGGEDEDSAYCGVATTVEGERVTCEKAPNHSGDHAGHVPEDAPGLTWDLYEWSDEEETEVRADGGTDLPTHDSVEDYAEDVDLSDLSDDDLDRLDDRVGDLLNGDPYEFPTDTALSAAFSLSTAISDENESRDPRRDDPYFHPSDTEERFALPITCVEIYVYGAGDAAEIHARFTLDESGIDGGRDASEWRLRPGTEIAATVLDYYGVDALNELGTVVGDTFPVVGGDRFPWGRVDRYALEHGTPAVETDDDADDTPEVLTDGGEDDEDDDE